MHMFSNIIYLNFEKNTYLISKALKLIIESYLNLKYFNIFIFYNNKLATVIIYL